MVHRQVKMDELECRFVIDRPTHTEEQLQRKLGLPRTDGDREPLWRRVSTRVRAKNCSKNCFLASLAEMFPIFNWMREYRKDWIGGDIIAGLTVGVVHIPQSLAFSLLAGLAPVFGLYTSFYPVLLYTFMGTSRHISVGTFAVTSILTRSVVERHVPEGMLANSTEVMNGTSGKLSLAEFEMARANVAAALMFIMGLFQLLFGIFRFGFITSYLSEPIIQGFTTGAACQVVTSQFPIILGFSISSFSGPLSLVFSWIEIFRNLPNTHVATLIITILCIIFLTAGREINIRFKDKMKIPLPTEVILVVITILASNFGKFESRFGVNIVNDIPTGFPAPQVPNMSILGTIIGDGLAIAIVGFVISVSLAKMYGTKHGYAIKPNQELIAYGVSNLIPSFFLCFPNAAALARCEIQDNTGGKSQVVGIISVVIVLIVILVLAPVFESLPRTVLGCIIIVGLFGILAQFKNLKDIYKKSKIDFIIWMVTWSAVVLLGVDLGLLVGVVFGIITVIVRTQRPRFETLVNISGTDIYRNDNCYVTDEDAKTSGIMILKLHASLYYANKDFFSNKLISSIGFDPADVLAKRKKAKDDIMKQRTRHESRKSVCCHTRVKMGNNGQAETQTASDVDDNPDSTEMNMNKEWKTNIQVVIIDCGSFGFIDFVGTKALKQFNQQFKELGISFLLANCSHDIRKMLMQNDYFSISGADSAFISVHDAVLHSKFQLNLQDCSEAL